MLHPAKFIPIEIVRFWKDCLLAELQVKMSRDGENSIIPSKYP